jgi:hypothetical protein
MVLPAKYDQAEFEQIAAKSSSGTNGFRVASAENRAMLENFAI